VLVLSVFVCVCVCDCVPLNVMFYACALLCDQKAEASQDDPDDAFVGRTGSGGVK
jgi:hypothetical protein